MVAAVHLHLAAGYALAGGQVTQGDLFRVQAAVAGAVALALVVRPTRTVWLATSAVGLASLLAVVVTAYVAVPAIGPFPRLFEPVWYAEKVLAAAAAGTAFLAGLAGLGVVGRQRRGQLPVAHAAARPGPAATRASDRRRAGGG